MLNRVLPFLLILTLTAALAAPVPGERLQPFSLPALGGESVRWEPGRVTVLSFVAFWCDTWKTQNRRLQETENALRGLPVETLTVSVDGRWAERARGIVRGPVLLDHGGSLSGELGVRAVPYTLVVDARGVVRHAVQGIIRGAELREVIRGLVHGEAPAADAPVYLTFDDFPAPEGDEELLDLLRAHRVPATFFCLGRNVRERPEPVRRAAAEGHSLQLHSWDHDAARPQLDRCAAVLLAVAGVRPALYRPPGTAGIRRLAGGDLTAPTVNPYDYTRPGQKELARRVLLAAKPGSVVLLHAGVAETRRALPDIIASLRRRGLTFGTLE